MTAVNSKWRKAITLLLISAAVIAFFAFDLGRFLELQYLKSQKDLLIQFYYENPALTIVAYFASYVLVTATSLPGATVMTLMGGAIFGLTTGAVIVSFASSIGATLAFLFSRFLFRDTIESKFGDRLAQINKGIEKDGAFYLFTLRLIPGFPFFMINLVMGLTKIRVLTFFIVSQIGMLPGTLVYVNAGTQITQIGSLSGILSPSLLISLALLGVFPLMARFAVESFKTSSILRKFNKPRKFDYDIVVIGAGSAGLVSAYIGAAVKAKVALVEKHKMGGDCLNTGCVPSKALLRSAKIMNYIKRASEFGLELKAEPEARFSSVMERVQSIIKEIEPHDSVERYAGLGVDCIRGEAKILSPYSVRVSDSKGERTLTTRNIIIATGASPLVPRFDGLDRVNYHTSETIWSLRERPKRMLIAGSGPIGCELAQAFSRLGSEVTVVEKADRILMKEDTDVSSFISERFKKEGIRLLTKHEIIKFNSNSESQWALCRSNGVETRIEFDVVVLALGRKANTRGLGLEELGITLNESGTIEHDEWLRAKYPSIFVCGDVAGPYQFTHTASHQAWYAAVNALFRPFKKYKADYRVIPWCTYTDPEVAQVGLNETEAQSKGIDYLVSRYGIDDLDRAICDSEAHGFVKVLTPKNSDRILGVTIVGPHAGDIIAEYVLAMKYGLGLNKILGTIHIYPTLSEANKFAAGVWKRQTAPQAILRWLAKFHAFRRG